MRPFTPTEPCPDWRTAAFCAAVLAALLAGCALPGRVAEPSGMGPTEAREAIVRLLPPSTDDRAGWATDIHAALATLELPSTPENLCAVLAVTEQESGFRADPAVPGLAAIAWKEIDRRADERRRAQARGARRARAVVAGRPQLCRAHRCGEDRAAAQRDLRGLHRHGAAGQDLLREPQPGAHRRADAGQHRVRRVARAGTTLSVSGARLGATRGVHAPRRAVLRHGSPARLRRALRQTVVPLRRFQRRQLCKPQRCVPERVESWRRGCP